MIDATAAVGYPVCSLGAAAVKDETPIGKDQALPACVEDAKHDGDRFEPFLRGRERMELFPVHSLWNCGLVFPGLLFRKIAVDLNNYISFGEDP